MKTTLKTTALILVIITLVSLFSGCIKEEIIPEYDIHTDGQANYLAGDLDHFSLYAKGKEELSIPEAIKLEWEASGVGKVTVSENADYSAPIKLEGEGQVDVYNLKIGTLYYYKIETSDGKTIKSGKFRTADVAPRNLYVDSVTNVRDIGGWKKTDGSMIKQGMIYRSSKLTADKTGEQTISDKGIATMRDTLGIVTELDLRRTDNEEQGGITESVLGNGVKYISFPMQSSGNCLTLNKELLPELFEILADESNYPLLFHCSIGTDRTGVVAFLMNALLGANEDDLYRDYLFSNFGNINGMRTNSAVKNYIKAVSSSDGNSLSEKTYNYLTSVGVDSKNIDSFLKIMNG